VLIRINHMVLFLVIHFVTHSSFHQKNKVENKRHMKVMRLLTASSSRVLSTGRIWTSWSRSRGGPQK